MMRRLFDLTALTIVSIATVYGIWRYAFVPYRCNVLLTDAKMRVRVAAQSSDPVLAAQLARRNIEDLQSCDRGSPGSTAAAMVLAGSYRIVGRLNEAERVYERLLTFDRRAEIYYNLGMTQLDEGKRDAALQNLSTACIYNPSYIDAIDAYSPEVRRALDAYQTQLATPHPPRR
jgi:tetratricopeptide (TPR) repeat protein